MSGDNFFDHPLQNLVRRCACLPGGGGAGGGPPAAIVSPDGHQRPHPVPSARGGYVCAGSASAPHPGPTAPVLDDAGARDGPVVYVSTDLDVFRSVSPPRCTGFVRR